MCTRCAALHNSLHMLPCDTQIIMQSVTFGLSETIRFLSLLTGLARARTSFLGNGPPPIIFPFRLVDVTFCMAGG